MSRGGMQRLSHMVFAAAIVSAVLLSPAHADSLETPEPPRVYLDTAAVAPTGRTIAVPANGDLQAALNSAVPGDVIELAAGATYSGNFALPAKTGSGWITVRTSTPDSALAPGRRITPAQSSLLAKLVSPNPDPALVTRPGAHHYRLIGLELTVSSAAPLNYGIVRLGAESQTAAEVPTHLIIDRCYIHGQPGLNVQRGITLNSASTAVINSHVSDIHWQGVETQAIAGWNGPGPFKIVNNHLAAAGINVLFGGANPSIPNLVPSDIEMRRNYFVKPLSWRAGDPTYAGIHWTAKNLLEIKAAQRLLVDGNILENSWSDAQEGWAIRLVLGIDLYAAISDIIFTNNIVRHAGYGLDICGVCGGTPPIPITRVKIANNLFTDITPQWASYAGGGWALMFRNGARNLWIQHNTFLQSGTLLQLAQTPGAGLRFTDNIANHNTHGVFNDGNTGTAALNLFFPGGWTFTKNALIGLPDYVAPTLYPDDNFFPRSTADVSFIDPSAGNYRLSPASPYRGAGTDGKDLGVDFDALNRAMAVDTTAPSPPRPAGPAPAPATAPRASSTPHPVPASVSSNVPAVVSVSPPSSPPTSAVSALAPRSTALAEARSRTAPAEARTRRPGSPLTLEATISLASVGGAESTPMRSPARIPMSADNDVTLPPNVSAALASAEPVGVITPSGGERVRGTIRIRLTPDAAAAASSVEFRVDDKVTAVLSPPHQSFLWDTRHVRDGRHTLSIIASTPSGQRASAPVSVIVSNRQHGSPGSITIASPLPRATVSGRLPLVVRPVAPSTHLTFVYSIDGRVFSTSTATAVELDTTLLDDGPHILSVVAHDAFGNTATASVGVIVVNNPFVRVEQAQGSISKSVAQVAVRARDVMSLAAIDVYVDSVLVGSLECRSLSCGGVLGWLVEKTGSHPRIVTAVSRTVTGLRRISSPLVISK